MIIWEYQQQIRTSPTDLHDNGPISGTMYYETLAGRPAERAYNWILEQMAAHRSIPSFAGNNADSAPVHTLEYNPDTGRYSLTLTDENNTLVGLKIGSQNGIIVSRDGNRYTFSTDQMIASPVTIDTQKDIVLYGTNLLIWGRPGYQTMMTGVADPLHFYLRFQTETFGTCKIVKTAEDGVVEGIRFQITGNGIDQTVTTGADGTVEIPDLMPGNYKVTELSPEKYEPQETREVTVVSGSTTTVTFNNVLKRGGLEVTKTSEDGLIEGVTFHLYGTSLSGLPVDEYAVTDASGVARFENVLVSGDTPYTLEEVDTAIRYVVPASQTAPIEWNEVTERSFANVLKKFRVTVTKTDAENGASQGDAFLAGAVYGIYRGEELVDTYTTDGNGQFTTEYYICGSDWSIREISPSEGYLLDTTVYHVGAEPETYTIELNSTANDVVEQVIKGSIALIKHTDDGETGIETPEAGAEFQVYLQAAGSFDEAKESERDTLVCDDNGFAQSKNLPYGVYVVHQTKGWEGRELMKDFTVYIAQDGQIYRYLINNANFESYIKVVKKDAETGITIPYEGAGFQIYDPSGELVTMAFTYPEVTVVDTFYTTAEGELITPETLAYGTGYSLVEVQAPYGYVVNREPIYFDVVPENAEEESGITLIEVIRENVAQKGIITVEKSGEVFASVTEAGGVYQPVYAVQGLAGAVYEITAAEDIITPDGTVRASQGEVVDTVTTGDDGTAKSRELYLGKYEVREITAPEGMVINNEIHSVELAYAGQEVAVTETSASFYNERQKVEINLQKTMETDEKYGIGNNREILSVSFGLYAAEELTAADGTAIPADGLIEVIPIDVNGQGKAATDLPLGSYYLQEIHTNAAYLLGDQRYPVTFAYGGQETALVSITANEGEPIENHLIYGSVSGTKRNEDGDALGGALIGIFRTGTEEFTAETAIQTVTSADDGNFSFEKVPYGTWLIREIESPAGFVLSEEIIPVAIGSAGEIVEIEIVNDFITGCIELTKVDRDYPENRLTGAAFEVYADLDGDGSLTETDSLLGTMTEYDKGVYRMENLRYGSYLVKETKAPEGFYLDTGVYAVSITEDGQAVLVENEAGKGFLNAMQHGSLQIKKTSEDGTLAGFRFQVTGTDILGNPFSAQYATDENGEIWITNLRIGSYTISELSGEENQRYVLPENQTVTIAANTISTVTFYNELRDVPDTGDRSTGAIYVAAMAVFLAGAAACFVQSKRRKQK